MGTHLVSVPVPYGSKSSARWSLNPSGAVVVFVHGFGGHAVDTWSEFDHQLPEHPDAAGVDLVFFGYDGLRAPVLTSSATLRETLREMMRKPAMFMNGTVDRHLHRPSSFRYKSVLVVAHSLGAVVARKALLDSHRARCDWLASTRLALFAPAHRGAPIIALVKEALGLFGSGLGPVTSLVTTYSSLRDLVPDCAFLKDLQQHTERALKDDKVSSLAAVFIGTAKDDKVVAQLDFVFDDCPVTPLDGTHTSVCKPTSDNSRPVDEIRALL